MQTSSDSPTLFDNSEQQPARFHRHVTETIAAFNAAVDPAKLTSLSNKSLAEVATLQQEIAQVIPAGNVAGLILSSLAQLKDRAIPPERARRDIEALMRGLDVVQKVFYNAAFFVSPAAVLYAYQKMLALAGKDIQSAFPEGLWQFYLEFSMREDTARHTNETIGFHQSLAAHNIDLPLADQLTAWVITAINLYFQYDDLLLTEWSERVYLNLLESEAEKAKRSHDPLFQNLKKKWTRQKPYRREQDTASTETYTQYRQRRFQRFCEPRLQSLPPAHRQYIADEYQRLLKTEGPAFQEQLSILATLVPGQYRETRRPIPLWQARVAVVWQDEYHLLPACAIDEQGQPLCFDLDKLNAPPLPLALNRREQLTHPRYGTIIPQQQGLLLAEKSDRLIGRLQPLPFHQLRHWVWAIIDRQYLSNLEATEFDTTLLQLPRNQQARRRKKLNTRQATTLELLKTAPIIINWDETAWDQPLAIARLGRRGVGDHALTIFQTAQTMIFDQSHIFFDGVWGLSLVEILTNEAISWASYLVGLSPMQSRQAASVAPKSWPILGASEASVESKSANLSAMMALRKNLAQRSREMIFTINDLLILYRSVFNREYQPGESLVSAVDSLANAYPQQAQAIRQGWQKLAKVNPALLIPMDAIDGAPKDRLYPISFRNPFPEFFDLFYQTYNALETYHQNRLPASWKAFNQRRSQLISELYYFGQLMLVHKKLALAGESTNMAALKLLGHLPDAVQSLLGKIPHKFDFLNEMLTGEEVFSNLGRVAPGTSPVRFISARDDNDAKTLVWGILTDDQNTIHISLRDFRPEVLALFEIDQAGLAQMMAHDFLDAYVCGLNLFVDKLNIIAAATVEETV